MGKNELPHPKHRAAGVRAQMTSPMFDEVKVVSSPEEFAASLDAPVPTDEPIEQLAKEPDDETQQEIAADREAERLEWAGREAEASRLESQRLADDENQGSPE